MIDIKNFNSNLLKIDKKPHKDTDIYYIGYITIKKFSDCKNIHSVNPLYLIFHSATENFKEKTVKNTKLLIRQRNTKNFFLELDQNLKKLNSGKELLYNKNYVRTGVNIDDNLPLNKPLKFPTLTIIIRCVFQEGEKLYPQIYLRVFV